MKDVHLENSLFRAVENDYAVVRAASDGASAIVSPRGEVLARRDHFDAGPAVIVADVSLGGGRTLFARLGDWVPIAAALVLLALLVLARRRRRG